MAKSQKPKSTKPRKASVKTKAVSKPRSRNSQEKVKPRETEFSASPAFLKSESKRRRETLAALSPSSAKAELQTDPAKPRKKQIRQFAPGEKQHLLEAGVPVPPLLRDRPGTENYEAAVQQTGEKITGFKDQAALNHGYDSWAAFKTERSRISSEIMKLEKEATKLKSLRKRLAKAKAGEPLPKPLEKFPDRSNVRYPPRKEGRVGRLPRYLPEINTAIPLQQRQADDPNGPHYDPRQANQEERTLRNAFGKVIRDQRVDELKLTTYEIAPSAYLDPNKIAAIERGEYRLSFSEMYRVANAVELNGEEMLTRWLEAYTGHPVVLIGRR